jgi:HEAT repeat protein
MMRTLLGRRSERGHWACRLVGLVLLTLVVSGCATFWDDVTSRNFTMSTLFTRQDPLVVLRDSSDGTQRARALAALEEPLAKGGTQQDQEIYVKILTTSALSDREPYCRLAAVRTLGRFKDPRAAQTLRAVYLQDLSFSAEVNALVRQQVLTSLAQTGDESARELLIRVAKEPPAEGSMQDKQETLDRRLNAIRGLGNFNHYESTETLLYLMKTEKDAAVRDRSHEALKKVTGKNLPADAVAWDELLHPANPTNAVKQASHTGYPGGIGDWLMKNVWQK